MPVNNYKQLLFIGVGGACGAVTRYSVTLLIISEGFPFATLFVNLIGCFLLSYLSYSATLKGLIPFHAFVPLTTGFFGSFTTFSAITTETVLLWKDSYILAMIYILSTFFGGLLLCFLGYVMVRKQKESV
ncbi:fluoride efflux transporter FluC [Aquibacillus albus]|uniref:Fluoride-specific ion channel FluC n=1 Tax=Aquibacillus albus TaxID=1168171 RepID=A0ABS2MYP1_9BACI|nr:CrcB family protein [Aquibacillus albus]MBM7570997.1 CrcB protein [Aquibacillus albus]